MPDSFREEGKPLFIYLSSQAEEHANATAAFEDAVVSNEKIAIAMKMFTPIEIDSSRVGEDHPYRSFVEGKEWPRAILIGLDGQAIGSLEGRINSAKAYKLMKKAVARTYKTKLDTFVKGYQKLLSEMDRIDAKIERLDEERAKVEEKKQVSKGQKRQWDRQQKELDQALDGAIESEFQLLEFRYLPGQETLFQR